MTLFRFILDCISVSSHVTAAPVTTEQFVPSHSTAPVVPTLPSATDPAAVAQTSASLNVRSEDNIAVTADQISPSKLQLSSASSGELYICVVYRYVELCEFTRWL